MDSKKFALRETLPILLGEVVCVAIMCAVFAVIGLFDASVLLGGAVGGILAVLNFFFMALGTGAASDKAQNQDVKGGQALIQFSYIGRMVALFLVWFLCLKTGYFHTVALVLPVLFVRPVITVIELFRKSGEKKR